MPCAVTKPAMNRPQTELFGIGWISHESDFIVSQLLLIMVDAVHNLWLIVKNPWLIIHLWWILSKIAPVPEMILALMTKKFQNIARNWIAILTNKPDKGLIRRIRNIFRIWKSLECTYWIAMVNSYRGFSKWRHPQIIKIRPLVLKPMVLGVPHFRNPANLPYKRSPFLRLPFRVRWRTPNVQPWPAVFVWKPDGLTILWVLSGYYRDVPLLVGGFKHLFSIIIIWDNPSHWLIFFKVVKTTNQLG